MRIAFEKSVKKALDKNETPPDQIPEPSLRNITRGTSEMGMLKADDEEVNEINTFAEINWKDPFDPKDTIKLKT